MTEHAQGWRIVGTPMPSGRRIYGPENTVHIARLNEGHPQADDFARLIAAAPETAAERDRLKAINADLLAALDDMLVAKGPARAIAERFARDAIERANKAKEG